VAQVFEDRSVALMLINDGLMLTNASFVRRKGLDDREQVSWLVRTSDAFVRTNDALVRGRGRMCERLLAGARRRRSPEEVSLVRCTVSPFWRDGRSLLGS
jgi:hypothetical protein